MYSMKSFTQLEIAVLILLGKFGLALPTQINRCMFPDTSKNRMYQTLHDLATFPKMVIAVPFRYKGHMYGNASIYYKLSTKGYHFVRSLPEAAPIVMPSSIQFKSDLHLMHALFAQEPIVLAHEIIVKERSAKGRGALPTFSVRFESEKWLQKHPLIKDSITLIPDAYIEISHYPTGRGVFILEYDRSSESLEKVGQKIYGYVELDHSAEYEARFGTKTMRVLFVCDSASRAEQLRKHTEYVLGRAHPQADLFCFGTSTDDALSFYFDPRWQIPGGETTALLKREWREGWHA